jgi:hypothetical protein
MRRHSIALLGLALAATLASPVMAGNMGTALDGNAGPDSRIPVPTEPQHKGAVTNVDGSQVIQCGCRNHRIPTFESPLEAALAG